MISLSVHSNILMRKHILSLIALGPIAADGADAGGAAHQHSGRIVETGIRDGRGGAPVGGRPPARQRHQQPTAHDPRSRARQRVRAGRLDERSTQLVRNPRRWTHSIRRRLDAVRRSGGIVDVRHRPQWQDRARRVGAAIAGRAQPRQQPRRHSRRRRGGTPRLSGRRSSHHPAGRARAAGGGGAS